MRKISLVLAEVIAAFSLSACMQLDVVGKDSVRAFNDVSGGEQRIAAPDDSAWFEWNDDYAVMSVEINGELLEFKTDMSREKIGYHGEMDHYNIDFGGGNMFEWAKDIAANDKDIVFVLNPGPFIAAGVDVNNIEGWAFAKVKTMDGEIDKLLKPFNLE